MKVTILVPTLGIRIFEIRRLLNSLNNQLYKGFEVVVVTQDNHDSVKKIIEDFQKLDVKQIKLTERGLSRARNAGVKEATGDIIVLSDDDCWYPAYALGKIVQAFKEEQSAKIVLTQIYDEGNGGLYKKYSCKREYISHKLQLMSRSSIEIAYKKDAVKYKEFDERLGLGSEFVCGEEVDFLLKNFCRHAYIYIPTVTVFHAKKCKENSDKEIVAKGALYKKNFSIFICLAVLLRDLFIKKENNFKSFFEGYHEYNKREN